MRRLLSYNNFKNLKFLENPTTWGLRNNMATMAVGPTTTALKQKIVVIMGATGSGKSKLSIDLATCHFPNSEIINSDKIQVLKGLNITTNKISLPQRRGVVHHLLGEFPPDFLLTPFDYRTEADKRISDITNRNKLPFIVGGSNSYIYGLLSDRSEPDPVQSKLRYNCCFIWVDVLNPVLKQYLDRRVDEMMGSGMYEELEEFLKQNGFSDPGSSAGLDSGRAAGLREAIGVPEMEGYFKGRCSYEVAVRDIKENTWQLAEKQMWKIQRLREVVGWDLQRIDATEAFRTAMRAEDGGAAAEEIWEKQVVKQSVKIVKHFLLE